MNHLLPFGLFGAILIAPVCASNSNQKELALTNHHIVRVVMIFARRARLTRLQRMTRSNDLIRDHSRILLEVARSQILHDIFNKAQGWWNDSDGQVKVVIVLKITEICPSPTQGMDCSWGLSDYDLSHTHPKN
jgi:hypothetical protein